jgi:predicted phage terminase large subunit-like protein
LFQSWDTANTATNLSDYSACTTWGVKKDRLYLLDVLRKRLEYPELKRVVLTHAHQFGAKNILIEDKASGTQLLQDLRAEGLHGVKAYKSDQHKIVRMNTVTATIENGFVYVADSAPWLPDFLHELRVFPNGRHDDQADSMSQALDWFKNMHSRFTGLRDFYDRQGARQEQQVYSPQSMWS